MKSRSAFFFFVIALSSVLTLTGCPKSPEETAQPAVTEAPKEAAKPEPAPAPAPEPKKEEVAPAPEKAAGLEPIYFDFDKSFIRDDAKPVMKANAAWLKANPKVKVKIGGNCDERGTIEYNQALGQRRAAAAKKYLTDMGISAKRITLISYGKEKPVCTQATEDCWQKNRRDDLAAE